MNNRDNFCVKCGAPLLSDKCAYCGSYYGKLSQDPPEDQGEDLFIRIGDGVDSECSLGEVDHVWSLGRVLMVVIPIIIVLSITAPMMDSALIQVTNSTALSQEAIKTVQLINDLYPLILFAVVSFIVSRAVIDVDN